jgi:nicotinamide mononucleotide transporter
MYEFFREFWQQLLGTGWMEFVAVISGIASVWFSKKENILVYPVGLVNTIFYVYLSIEAQLIGEATVNFYYTVVSLYGWYLWTRKDRRQQPALHITFSSKKEWMQHLAFFAGMYAALYFALVYLQKHFYPGAIPWADSFAAATAFTGMWLMAKKKVESWIWWIATDIASPPLYYVKGFAFSSVYYVILLAIAFFGLMEWRQRARNYALASGASEMR